MSAAGRLGLVAPLLTVLASPVHADIPVVDLDGVVHAVTAGHVVRAIDRADAERAPLLVLRLDTPGGLDTSMRQIVDKMLNCRTPIVAFVGPSGARAASAGFVILLAADVAAMAPGTNIGAAHPVSGLGGQMDEVMSKKITSDAAAYIRSKAERRGRNVEMAEKGVVESKSFTEKEALETKLIDLVAKDVPELLQKLDGREVKRFDGSVVRLETTGERTAAVKMDWRQMILSAIARPEVLFLLLMGALAGLGTEISHPGLLFPGILGVICLILFLFATQIIPVNWAGVLLVVLAIGLFAAEVKVASYGLLTVAGIAAMILGAMMLVDSPLPELRVNPWKLAAGGGLHGRLHRPSRAHGGGGAEEAGHDGRGRPRRPSGVAATALEPEGWVLVQGERWRAQADDRLDLGARVEIVGMDGLRLRVRKGA